MGEKNVLFMLILYHKLTKKIKQRSKKMKVIDQDVIVFMPNGVSKSDLKSLK